VSGLPRPSPGRLRIQCHFPCTNKGRPLQNLRRHPTTARTIVSESLSQKQSGAGASNISGSGTYSFSDPCDYQASFRDVFATFTLSCGGVFAASQHRATLNHLRLLQAQESQARVAYVMLPTDSVFISFSWDPALPLIWRGLRLEPGEIILHGRGERMHQRSLGPSCWGLIWLPPASLAAFSKTVAGHTFAAPDRGKILRPSVQDRKHLLHIHAGASRLAGTKPRTLAHPEIIRAMEQELVDVLVSCLTSSEERVETLAVRRAGDIMMCFEEMLASTALERWSVAELHAAAGVSERTFRGYCATFLGTTPYQYMRLRRLMLVHAAILRTDGVSAKIGDLARAGGFTEPGHFATLYRVTFGETPSATRRRSADG
jgi:AraC-like DNA-binding protein